MVRHGAGCVSFLKREVLFKGKNRVFSINYAFDCDSKGVVYMIICKRCEKVYVDSTITSLRKMFNNHKSSLQRYDKGQRNIAGEYLYSHFFSESHKGLEDVNVMIIDKTDLNDPTNREGFRAYKLNTFIPNGLNSRNFL